MGKDPDDGQPGQDLNLIGVTNTPAGLDELAVQCVFTLVPSKKRSPSTPIKMQSSVSVVECARR